MEPKSTQSQDMINVVKGIMEAIECGNTGKEDVWYKYFHVVLNKLNKPHDLSILAKDILPIFGGMGTFNDLVLHKDPVTPLIEENDRMNLLSDKLFSLCEDILGENESNN